VKTVNLKFLALAVGFAFGGAAVAQSMPKDDYQAGKDRIAAESKAAKAACTSLFGNARDVCRPRPVAAAIAGAELDASWAGEVSQSGTGRQGRGRPCGPATMRRPGRQCEDVCIKEATAVETAAKADAKAQLITANAKAVANEKSDSAFSKASAQAATAREEAATATNDAQYAVAVEKCAAYAGGAKDVCLNSAKVRFGKS
jgi:hypothetical protein